MTSVLPSGLYVRGGKVFAKSPTACITGLAFPLAVTATLPSKRRSSFFILAVSFSPITIERLMDKLIPPIFQYYIPL